MNDTLLCSGRNRDLTAISTTPMPWNHVAPRGEFPGTVEIPAGYDVPGYGVAKEDMEVEGLTVFDDRTLESMVQQFRGDVLIDADHLSHDKTQSTEALGWGQRLRYLEDRNGLEMQTAWTPPGCEKITGKIYRYLSPEFAGAVRFEAGTFKFYPSAIVGAGLTNRPKLTLRPVSANREASKIPREESIANDLARSLVPLAKEHFANGTEARDSQITAAVAAVKDREKCDFQTAWAIAKAENPELFYQKDSAAPDGGKVKETQRTALVARLKNRDKSDFSTAWSRAKAEKPELFI